MMHHLVYDYIEDGKMNGIFKHYQNNLFSFFSISASSTQNKRGSPNNIIDQSINSIWNNNTWISNSIENSSFVISFKRFQFKLSSYSIMAREDSEGNFPAEWKIEGSQDNSSWEIIDHPERTEQLGTPGTYHFIIKTSSQPFKYFKMTMIGKNYKSSLNAEYCFAMRKIEFFGSAFVILQTCKYKISFPFSFPLFFTIIMKT